MIAHKLYGDPELHWIILLVNDITDRYHQWPMSGGQFLDYLNDKYETQMEYIIMKLHKHLEIQN